MADAEPGSAAAADDDDDGDDGQIGINIPGMRCLTAAIPIEIPAAAGS